MLRPPQVPPPVHGRRTEVPQLHRDTAPSGSCCSALQSDDLRRKDSRLDLLRDAPGETFHCAKRWAVVTKEGDQSDFFVKDEIPSPSTAGGVSLTGVGDGVSPTQAGGGVSPTRGGVEVDPSFFGTGNQAEDIALARNMDFNVNDDNEPAEENIPTPVDVLAAANDGLYPGQTWGWGD